MSDQDKIINHQVQGPLVASPLNRVLCESFK